MNLSQLSDYETNGESTPLLYNPDNHSRASYSNDTAENTKGSSLPTRRRYILMLCAAAHFLSGVAFSLLGPFYPQEATKKGMSVPLTGFVFGVFDVVIFCTSPIVGNYLAFVGPKFVYLTGIFIGGFGTILFGLVDKCPAGTPFIVTSIMCRCVSAFGFSCYTTTSFAIVSSVYFDKIGTAFGVMETSIGIGFMIGPAIGGALYDVGGFGFPFFLTGVFILLNAVLIYNLLPAPHGTRKERKRSAITLIQNPLVLVPMCSIFVGFLGVTTFDSTFSNHLRELDLSTSIIGLFFALTACTYSLMAPLWGYISDKKDIQAPIIVAGHVIYGVGFLVVGPSPLLPFIPFDLWAMGVGPVLIGVSFGCALIPTMKCMVKGALELGFDNDIDTYALVSGLFNFVNCLGGFVGPVSGGAVLDAYGFPILYTVIGLISFSMTLVSLVFFSIRYSRSKRGLHTQNMDLIEESVDSNSNYSMITARRLSFSRSLSNTKEVPRT